MPQIDPSRIRKILVVRPDAIGDLALTTPAIAALRNSFPRARLVVLARKYNQLVIRNNPAVDEVIIDDIHDRIAKGKPVGLRRYWRWIGLFQRHKFDLMINFYGEFPYALIARLAGVPWRVGDSGKVLFSWLYNLRARQNFRDPTIHEVEHQFELLKPLGISLESGAKLELFPDPADLAEADRIIKENGLQGQKLIAVNLGTGGSDKAWAPANVKELIKLLAEKYRTRVILLGGPKEKGLVKKVLPELGPVSVDLVGLPLAVFFGLLGRLDLLIANNTGPVHLAAALRVPVVVLYVSKFQKPGRWAPWGTRHKLIKAVSRCPYPCLPPACRKSICVTEITAATVAAAAGEILDSRHAPTPEEDRLERARSSLNILVSGREPETNAAFKMLKGGNWRVWELSAAAAAKMSLPKLYGLLVENDVNLILALDRTPGKLKLAALFASLRSGAQISRLESKGREFRSPADLVRYYSSSLSSSSGVL